MTCLISADGFSILRMDLRGGLVWLCVVTLYVGGVRER